MNMENIKAILFDSGRTLNVPRTGHWFITPNAMKIISREDFTLEIEELYRAIGEVYSYINEIPLVKTEIEEYLMFKKFYELVLKEINYPNITEEIIELLAKDNVYNDDKFLFFDDIEKSLNVLKDKFLLGIVSDTWPSLERVFINKGLRKYFSTFVMSSVYGSNKSENLLFEIAIKELDINPKEIIFVDDSEKNLKVAEKIGLVPILIDVYKQEDLKSEYKIINSISELIIEEAGKDED